MIPPIIITLTRRSNAAKYQVTYDDSDHPRCVSVWKSSSRTGCFHWRAIWNSDYPLEGKALAAIEEAERWRRVQCAGGGR
jgi:hypothetical protein